ncbi:hypothetical protein HC891_02055 [Candidatus Gracilibacteria bacterium]|nr:hypothetical protein [Candidatus Gracilibacteria bacterium]
MSDCTLDFSAAQLTFHSPALIIGWSRETGSLNLLRLPDSENLLAYGAVPPTVDIAVDSADGWLSQRTFPRYLRHRFDQEEGGCTVTIEVGFGPLIIADRYEIVGQQLQREVHLVNTGDDLLLYGVRLLVPLARIEPADSCCFDAPGNSVRPHVGLAVAATQHRAILPRRFFAPGLRGSQCGRTCARSGARATGAAQRYGAYRVALLVCKYAAGCTALPGGHAFWAERWPSCCYSRSRGRCGRVFARWQQCHNRHTDDRAHARCLARIACALPCQCPAHERRSGELAERCRHLHDGCQCVRRLSRPNGGTWRPARAGHYGYRPAADLARPSAQVCYARDEYAVSDFDRIERGLGDEDDLAALFVAAHQLDMRLLLDVPLQGCAGDSRYIQEHPEWFARDVNGTFIIGQPQHAPAVHRHPGAYPPKGVYLFDWANRSLRAFWRTWMQRQCERFALDGFRIYNPGPLVPQWQRRQPQAEASPHTLLTELRSLLRQQHPDAVLIGTLSGPLYDDIHDASYDTPAHAMFVHMALNRISPQEMSQYLIDYHAIMAQRRRIGFLESQDTSRYNPLADGLRGSRISRMVMAGMVFCGYIPALWHGQFDEDAAFFSQLLHIWHSHPALRTVHLS